MTSVDGTATAVRSLPLIPKNPLPYAVRFKAARQFTDGQIALHRAGGAVTRNVLGPKWLTPPLVFIASPQGVHDVLARTDEAAERGTAPHMVEMRGLMGDNILSLTHRDWLPRRRTLQPLFTKQTVARFAGHMSDAARSVADGWADGTTIDLDAATRAITLRALGHSVFGLDLEEQSDVIGAPLRTAFSWVADRAFRPVRAPRWLPTPARRRARGAATVLHGLAAEILRECRIDPDRDAPLVRALMDAKDPATGQRLSDDEICHDLVVFMLAGHDTTATTLAYALWQLGRHRDLQERVVSEVHALGGGPITIAAVPRLGYTVQVLDEALRLCPAAPAFGRMIDSDIVVDGHRVEAGSFALLSAYALHRDPALWDDPQTFDPDRFSPERSRGRDRWQYIPFGGGPRKCIGDHFAMLEATLALATIVSSAEIRSLSTDFPLAVPFTAVAAEPILATAHRRATS
ncbi:cytochrome P450 [Mycobacterium sp. 23]|uniref:cytochrome P450 n=1 Tax=Mycobacterium sp. 23 TaxID=3400424 RepID=UPI003AABC498